MQLTISRAWTKPLAKRAVEEAPTTPLKIVFLDFLDLLCVFFFSDFVLLLVIISPPYHNEDRHGRGKRDGDPRENEKKGGNENGYFPAKPGFSLRLYNDMKKAIYFLQKPTVPSKAVCFLEGLP